MPTVFRQKRFYFRNSTVFCNRLAQLGDAPEHCYEHESGSLLRLVLPRLTLAIAGHFDEECFFLPSPA